ncbi:MAG: tRNA (adenosine(37)-N6)-threonylcarbamoyltransferase complex dimerization subunit type 1 TsaB [Spirochaetae bacterium HGW-Spirochaetae-9]|nr:MAG: tRNA (adenosine(37)-N6)-threonylcarbamoyltransferase complex dimerization subunit type 1 TsaB [Spirochaetae bacterium HGW-Spirochaetae-9]
MNVLAFDTATDLLAVAVKNSEGSFFVHTASGFRHSETLLHAIERCLAEASLTLREIGLIACTSGPGSFTGLRIGMATAKGLSLALGIPWVGVPTLDCIAQGQMKAARTIVPVLDARKNRLYSALYKDGRRVSDFLDISLTELLALVDGDAEVDFIGPDADLLADYALERPGFYVLADDPAARLKGLALLGEMRYEKEGPAAEDEGPLYMREPEIGLKAP